MMLSTDSIGYVSKARGVRVGFSVGTAAKRTRRRLCFGFACTASASASEQAKSCEDRKVEKT